MNLADLITALEAEDPAKVCPDGFRNPHSYRGDYMDLAFEPATNVTVGDMLTAARSALGTTYQGYKGGEFTMASHSWCWLSEEGDVSGETISALLLRFMLASGTLPGATDTTVTTASPEADKDVLTDALGPGVLMTDRCSMCGHPADDHDLQPDGTRPCRTPGHPKGVPCAGCRKLLSPEHREAIQEERENDAFRAAWGAFFVTLLDAKAAFGESAPAFFSDIHESALASALITYRQHANDAGGA